MMLFIGNLGPGELLFLAIPFLLWIWALLDVLKSNFKDGATKIVWVLVIILLPFLGVLLYLLFGRSQRVVI
ncbi:PLDc N-terminal domain-containing protein [Rufibacter glacialis]|uniref:PLDc N-terminal domain-containing protein n=1 Tax=Rufibacter glacialis TaxID=1259555 RepID=A0A5M8QAS9_9BACT|nr:hypothetical protein FOE74_14240 [Rufibacter glacialis]